MSSPDRARHVKHKNTSNLLLSADEMSKMKEALKKQQQQLSDRSQQPKSHQQRDATKIQSFLDDKERKQQMFSKDQVVNCACFEIELCMNFEWAVSFF